MAIRPFIRANAGCARNPGSPSASIKTKLLVSLMGCAKLG